MQTTNRNYLLGTLTVLLAFNYMDRLALGIVLQDIKIDLQLSDSQLGFLSGMAFALFYSILGIPIARLADRFDRVMIISLCSAVWSIAVFFCGSAATFIQLMLMRILVGIGEAGCVPPSLSLIADYFSRSERPRAVSMYLQGISASFLIGCLAAGWLNEVSGWRLMFVAIGLPGVLIALVTRLTIKDPRANRISTSTATDPVPTLLATLSTIWKIATFRRLLYSLAVNWFFTYGVLQWIPTFFTRSFNLKSGELGTWLAVIYGITNLLGTYVGGELVTRYASQRERRQLSAMAVAISISGIFMALVFVRSIASNYYLAFFWLALSMFTAATANGPPFAILQTLVPPNMRSLAIAIVYLFGNLIGIGLGPWSIGLLSDALRAWGADDPLGNSMLLLSPGFIWSAWYFWKAAQSVDHDLRQIRSETETEGQFTETALHHE